MRGSLWLGSLPLRSILRSTSKPVLWRAWASGPWGLMPGAMLWKSSSNCGNVSGSAPLWMKWSFKRAPPDFTSISPFRSQISYKFVVLSWLPFLQMKTLIAPLLLIWRKKRYVSLSFTIISRSLRSIVRAIWWCTRLQILVFTIGRMVFFLIVFLCLWHMLLGIIVRTFQLNNVW